MRELYNSPVAEVVEFDVKDVITTSGEDVGFIDNFTAGTSESANESSGWTGLYQKKVLCASGETLERFYYIGNSFEFPI